MKTLTKIRSFGLRCIKCDSGVTAIEYSLIGSLVALVIVVAVTTVGTSVGAMFTAVAAVFP